MTIKDFIRLAKANLLLILVTTVIGAVLGFGYSQVQPKVYQANTRALVVVAGTDAFTANSVAQQKASAFSGLVGSKSVSDRVAEALGLTSGLGGSLSGAADASGPIITISAQSSDPARARDLANASVKALGDEINQLESFSSSGATVDPNQTTASGPTSTSIVQLEEATLPSSPVFPDARKLTLMGLGLGLAVGIALGLFRKVMDNRVRHISDVEEILHTSVLAVVPKSSELDADGRRNVDGLGEAAEALRHLRTNLRFVDIDNPPRAIVMTSANAGEGKSTISAVLAQMLAASGQRTILVDADLRKPVVHKIFQLDGTLGLTQLLAGDLQASDVAQAVEGQPHLRVIPAGQIPPNPSELLGSQRMKALIDRLSQEAIVILDAPPLLPVTDAGLLTGLADGAILVFETGGTYKEQAKLCGSIMQQVGGRLLGVVMNRAPRHSISSVYYGYGNGNYRQRYYYYYHGQDQKKIFGIFPRRKKPTVRSHTSAPFSQQSIREETSGLPRGDKAPSRKTLRD